MKQIEPEVLIKTAATMRKLAEKIGALEKEASDYKSLVDGIRICEILEKKGHLGCDDSIPITKRAQALMGRSDFDRLSRLAEHGGKAYKTAQMDGDQDRTTDKRSPAEVRFDNLVLYGSKATLEDQ